jgi:hypothetical protein
MPALSQVQCVTRRQLAGLNCSWTLKLAVFSTHLKLSLMLGEQTVLVMMCNDGDKRGSIVRRAYCTRTEQVKCCYPCCLNF